MRKTVFLVAIVIALILIIKIIHILIYDWNRLTDYGIGYLVGKIILFLIFVGIAFIAKTNKIKTER